MNRLRSPFASSSATSRLWGISSTTPSLFSSSSSVSAVSSTRPASLWFNSRRNYSDAVALTPEIVSSRVIKVVKNFHKVGENAAVNDKSHFANDLGLDSLDTVELVLALEDEFCIEIPETDADKIHTTSDAIQYLLTNPHAK